MFVEECGVIGSSIASNSEWISPISPPADSSGKENCCTSLSTASKESLSSTTFCQPCVERTKMISLSCCRSDHASLALMQSVIYSTQ